MNKWLKSIALMISRGIAPNSTERFVAYRIRRHIARFSMSTGLDRILRQYTAANGTLVSGGPFAGLRYVDQAAGSTVVPKLIGSYESELHSAISAAIDCRPTVVIDVGCAEGYYAVGLARALPAATVYAFDIDSFARDLCSRMAALNEVDDRIVIGSRCDPTVLGQLLVPRALVVCDCEGYERDLLDPASTPALCSATLIIELHEHRNMDLTSLMTDRFGKTHILEFIRTVDRDPEAYPTLAVLDPIDRAKAISEYRNGPQEWMVATPVTMPAGHPTVLQVDHLA